MLLNRCAVDCSGGKDCRNKKCRGRFYCELEKCDEDQDGSTPKGGAFLDAVGWLLIAFVVVIVRNMEQIKVVVEWF